MKEAKKYRSMKEIENAYLPKYIQKKKSMEISDPQILGKQMAEDTFSKVRDKFPLVH